MKNKTIGEIQITSFFNTKLLSEAGDRYDEYLRKSVSETMDQFTRNVLMSGTSYPPAKLTKWQLLKLRIKLKIKNLRVSIAEWIGGEDLHEYCD